MKVITIQTVKKKKKKKKLHKIERLFTYTAHLKQTKNSWLNSSETTEVKGFFNLSQSVMLLIAQKSLISIHAIFFWTSLV